MAKLSILVMAVCFSFIACKSITAGQVTGTYVLHHVNDFYTEAIFTEDSFYFRESGHLLQITSKGIWKLKGSTIYLTSNPDYKNGYITVEERKEEQPYIEVVNVDVGILAGALLTLEDGRRFKCYPENKIWIDGNSKIKSFEISYISEKYKYTIQDSLSNSYKVTFLPYNVSKRYYDKTAWKMKSGNKIKTGSDFILTKKP